MGRGVPCRRHSWTWPTIRSPKVLSTPWKATNSWVSHLRFVSQILTLRNNTQPPNSRARKMEEDSTKEMTMVIKEVRESMTMEREGDSEETLLAADAEKKVSRDATPMT